MGGGIYVGEWSSLTNLPHGRGIHINQHYLKSIGYWYNGLPADTGKYIYLKSEGEIHVGEYTRDACGIWNFKYMQYNPDGSSKQFGK
jgi:hypothetical protein